MALRVCTWNLQLGLRVNTILEAVLARPAALVSRSWALELPGLAEIA